MSGTSKRLDRDVGPWGLPVSGRAWYVLFAFGILVSFLTMGLVYELTQRSFVGPVSVPEASGLFFFIVWSMLVIGPFSPFSIRGDTDE